MPNKHAEEIAGYTLMDDVLMKPFFQGNLKAAQRVINAVLRRKDLVVEEIISQDEICNIYGRSIRMDALVKDTLGRYHNIEVQHLNSWASLHRARMNRSLLDAHLSEPNMDPNDMPDTYIIFFVDGDVFEKGLPVYTIEQHIKENGEEVSDGTHIIYVNVRAKFPEGDELGELVLDFICKDADEMYDQEFAERFKYLKGEGGEKEMGGTIDMIEARGRAAGRSGVAQGMLRDKLPFEMVTKYTGLSEQELRKMQAEMK